MTNSNNVIANLLTAGGQEIAQSDLELAGRLEAWLAQNHGNVFAALDAEAPSAFTQQDIAGIPAEIFRAFFPTSTAVRMTGILTNAIDQANHLYERTLPLTPIGQVRRRQKSPWSPDILENAACANRYISAFEQMIKADIPADASDNYAHLALVVPSAILFGGILHRDSLVALVRACADPMRLWNYFGQRLQLELHISWRREADAERRFWFPDALTTLLLMRFRVEIAHEAQSGLESLTRGGDASDADISNWLWTKVLRPFRRAARASKATEKSLPQLLNVVTSRYRMATPTVLLAYMTREILSSSRSRSAFARVHGVLMESGNDAPPEIAQIDGGEIENEPDLARRDLSVLEADWLDEIRSAFRGASIAIIRKSLRSLAENYAPGPAKRFAEFGAWLLVEHSAFGSHLALSTVKTYTRVLAVRLGGILGDRDPAERLPSELLSDYLDVLEEASEGGRRKSFRLTVARAINEFHVFLSRRYDVGPIHPSELGLGRAGSTSVDANLITESDYGRIAAYTRRYAGAADNSAIVPGALLLLQLGFRAGLRRDEAQHLRISDLLLAGPHTSKVAEIHIRPWGTHQLKSANAIRRLPVELLFDQEENVRLEEWIARQMKVNGVTKDVLLFNSSEPEAASSPFHRMISLVASAMRDVTGDRHLRFHHLRHSAASCRFARFMLYDAEISPSGWPSRLMPIPRNEPKTVEIYQALTDSSGASRKPLFAIACLTGHSDPDTDCAYYIHAFDGLQATFLESSLLASPRDLLVAATDLRPTQAYALVKRSGAWALANRHAPRVWPEPTAAQRLKDSEPQSRIWLDELYDFLIRPERPSANPIEDLASDYGFDPLDAIRMIDQARRLRDLRSLEPNAEVRNGSAATACERALVYAAPAASGGE